jgi:hypothetical protein
MLHGVHAICGSASAPTAEHQRRRPGMAMYLDRQTQFGDIS